MNNDLPKISVAGLVCSSDLELVGTWMYNVALMPYVAEIVLLSDDPDIFRVVGDVLDESIYHGYVAANKLVQSRPHIRIEVDYEKEIKSFAQRRNKLQSLCKSEWIFQLDMDESLKENAYLSAAIRQYNCDIFAFPRDNRIHATKKESEEISKFIDEKKWSVESIYHGSLTVEYRGVNFPDYQARLYRNNGTISWQGNVHEHLTKVPDSKFYVAPDHVRIIHSKTAKKQISSEEKYKLLG